MKKTTTILGCAIFLTGAVFTSCSSPAEKVENKEENVVEANESLEKANAENVADMEAFRKENNERILANDKSIAEFKAKVANEKREARIEYTEKINELERKNSDYKKRLEEYNETGSEKWVAFKSEFNHDMDGLGMALKDLTIKNKK